MAPSPSGTAKASPRRVREAAGDRVDGVFDAVGKTPIQDLITLVPQPPRSSPSPTSVPAVGGAVTGGGSDARPFDALAETASLLEHGKIVIKIQTFPLDRAIEAYRISLGGHLRGKLVLLP